MRIMRIVIFSLSRLPLHDRIDLKQPLCHFRKGQKQMDSNTNTIKWDWRLNFSSNPVLLDQGAQDVDNNKVLDFEEAKDRSSATCKTFGGFHCGVYAPTSYSECRGYGIWRTGGVYYGRGRRRRGYSFWNDDDADSRFQCDCSTG